MSKQEKKHRTSRRLAKWFLRLPLVWRIVSAMFAIFGLLVAVQMGVCMTRHVVEAVFTDDYRIMRQMSGGYNHRLYYEKEYAIGHRWDRKPVLHQVDWVAGHKDDSLWVVSRAGRRAYFNTSSGRLVMPFQYRHAWLFSEGVAAVVDTNGWLSFISADGRQACPNRFRYSDDHKAPFLFHKGLCPMYDTAGRAGLIEYMGRWTVPAHYDSVCFTCGYWALMRGDSLAVADSNGRIVVAMAPGHRLRLTEDGNLELWHRTRPARLYAPDGRLLAAQTYDYVCRLLYTEGDADNYNSEYKATGLYEYWTDMFHRGMLDGNGRVLTDAIYSSIEALNNDVFRAEYNVDLCEYYSTSYVLLDRQGKIINQKE